MGVNGCGYQSLVEIAMAACNAYSQYYSQSRREYPAVHDVERARVGLPVVVPIIVLSRHYPMAIPILPQHLRIAAPPY